MPPLTVIPLGRSLLIGSSDLPESLAHRAGTHGKWLAPSSIPSLFGLAPCGVCHASRITARPVRSYRTFSPLPQLQLKGSATACACFALAPGSSRTALTVRSPGRRRYILCGTFRKVALTPPSRTLSGTLLCGVRTFLSLDRAARETRRSQPRQRPSGSTSAIHIIR